MHPLREPRTAEAAETAGAAGVLMVISLFVLVARDLSLENKRLGVTSDLSEGVRILYLGCRDEQITTVELVDVRGKVGDDDDTVVWKAEADHPVRSVDVIVGEGGAGFEETTPLTTDLAGEYTVILNYGRENEILQGVDVGSLEPELVDTGDEEPLSVEEFEREAFESCG